MPRELTPTRNFVEVFDPQAGEVLRLYYRTPSTTERVAYRAEQLERDGDAIIQKVLETRVLYGAKILTGVAAEAFSLGGAPLSSEPGAPGYREDWKALLALHAPELLEAIAVRVFESARVMRVGKEEPPVLPQARTAGEVVEAVDAPLGNGSAGS